MRRDLSTWALAAACHAQLFACAPTTSTAEPADPAQPSKPVTPMAYTSTNTDELVGKLVCGAYGDFFNYAIREGRRRGTTSSTAFKDALRRHG
jgi:hypothetical protein